MIKTIDELTQQITGLFTDTTSDDCLSMLEDLSDTFQSLSTSYSEDWEKKYKENDKMWREKYRERFLSGKNTQEIDPMIEPPEDKKLTFEALFSSKKE